MHDLSLANQITNSIKKYSRENKIKKLRKISLLIGNICGHHHKIEEKNKMERNSESEINNSKEILPFPEEVNMDNLKFNIKLLLGDEDVDIEINNGGGNKWELIEVIGI